MSHVTIVYGRSGSGKTFAAIEAAKVFLEQGKKVVYINVTNKNDRKQKTELSQKYENFKNVSIDDPVKLRNAINNTKVDLFIVDDFTYLLRKEFMKTADEKGYTKFSLLAQSIAFLFDKMRNEIDGRVLILNHLDVDNGDTKLSTIGKMLDEKYNMMELSDCNIAAVRREDGYMMVVNTMNIDGTCYIAKTPYELYNESLVPFDLIDYYNKLESNGY